MAGDEGEKNLEKAADWTPEQEGPKKIPGTESLFHTPAKKVDTETIEEHVPGPWSGMKKLERKQLPDSAVKETIPGEGQVFRDIKAPIEEEDALDDEGNDQDYDQTGSDLRGMIFLPHVRAIAKGHNRHKGRAIRL